jgi:hypothetical protein
MKCVKLMVLLIVGACSNGTTGTDGGTDASPGNDAATNETGGQDAAQGNDAGTDAASAAVTLTVMNFLDWCSVAVNGGTASTGANVTASVTGGSVATIVITPASNAFQIGANPWFGVDQNDGGAAPGVDNGTGATETSTATVTIKKTGTTQCVSVCCQEPNNSPTPCPTTNPCP